ncbi:MAG: nucleotidyltransferase family protein [Bacteroidales bacterium]|nr:nucleotidyltransferase family protein [Bacteroidales bacterium]
MGTRLKSVVADVPKPMAKVAERPFLTYILDDLDKQGFDKIVLAVGYKYEVIQSHFGHRYKNLQLLYSVEDSPLGTGGAIRKAFDLLDEDHAFVINGDTFLEMNYAEMEAYAKAQAADLCMALKPMKAFDRYGSITLDGRRIIRFNEKQFIDEGLINAGIYRMKKSLIEHWPVGEKFSFETEVMEKEVANRLFIGQLIEGYFIDIGIPEDFARAQNEFSQY